MSPSPSSKPTPVAWYNVVLLIVLFIVLFIVGMVWIGLVSLKKYVYELLKAMAHKNTCTLLLFLYLVYTSQVGGKHPTVDQIIKVLTSNNVSACTANSTVPVCGENTTWVHQSGSCDCECAGKVDPNVAFCNARGTFNTSTFTCECDVIQNLYFTGVHCERIVCNPGYFLTQEGLCTDCPPNHYCRLGHKLACPNGTQNLPMTQSNSVLDCECTFPDDDNTCYFFVNQDPDDTAMGGVLAEFSRPPEFTNSSCGEASPLSNVWHQGGGGVQGESYYFASWYHNPSYGDLWKACSNLDRMIPVIACYGTKGSDLSCRSFSGQERYTGAYAHHCLSESAPNPCSGETLS